MIDYMEDRFKFDKCENCGIMRTYHLNKKCPRTLNNPSGGEWRGREMPEEQWESHKT